MKKRLISIWLAAALPFMGGALPPPPQTAATRAAALLATVEGFRSTPYLDAGGRRTIGYGFTSPAMLARGRMTQAAAQAELTRLCNALDKRIKADFGATALTANERAAVISFAYNVGYGRFKSTTLYRLLKCGVRGKRIAAEIQKWRYVRKGGKQVACKGLQRRRALEAALFTRRS